MKILAVEFSSAQRSVSVWEGGGNAASAALLGSAMETVGHRGLGLVEEALKAARCSREEIGVLAVGLGPGSYTGIRGSIALAQGWQLGRDIKLLGISSVECLAAQAFSEGRRGAVNIIIDAQRNEFYLARYQMDEHGAQNTAALRLGSFAEIQALGKAGEILAGPGIRKWFDKAEEMYPGAVTLGRLACGRNDFVPGEKLEPIYLRETAFKKAPPPREIP